MFWSRHCTVGFSSFYSLSCSRADHGFDTLFEIRCIEREYVLYQFLVSKSVYIFENVLDIYYKSSVYCFLDFNFTLGVLFQASTYLELFTQLQELGFNGEKIQEALVNTNNDREKTLDILTASSWKHLLNTAIVVYNVVASKKQVCRGPPVFYKYYTFRTVWYLNVCIVLKNSNSVRKWR